MEILLLRLSSTMTSPLLEGIQITERRTSRSSRFQDRQLVTEESGWEKIPLATKLRGTQCDEGDG